MNNACPHSQAQKREHTKNRPISHPDSQVKEIRHIVEGIHSNEPSLPGYTPTEEMYVDFAILIQDFVQKNEIWIQNILENCYDPDITKEVYLSRIYGILSSKLQYEIGENYPLYSERLIGGVGTAILILDALFAQLPHLTQSLCIGHCEYIMKHIDIYSMPAGKTDKREKYYEFIRQYLEGKIPVNETGKLYCPVKYTPEGNQLIRRIIGAIYKYFPS